MNIRILITSLFTLLLAIAQLSAQPYTRVVSLAQSITENIYQLQAQEKLVGCTSYCIPAQNDGVEVVASSITINIEKVLSLKPDLILATGITTPDNIELLRKFNIKVQVFPTPKTFEEICTQFTEIGSLLGKKEFANHFIDTVKLKVNDIKSACIQNTQERIFMQIGANPLFTVLPNTFMDDYIQHVNGINIAHNLSRGTISRESVLSRSPDYIFVVTMGVLGSEQKKLWDSYNKIPAVIKNNVYIIDSNLACTPTPHTFLRTLEIIYDLINH